MRQGRPLGAARGGLPGVNALRFDDMIATVLGQVPHDATARTAAWRQLVDLAAQARDSADPLLSDAVYERLKAWRADVPEAQRATAARSLAGRRLSAHLVEFFAGDRAHVAAPLLTTAALTDAEWLALLPRLSPTARSLVRHRRDLAPPIVQALASFGATDMVIAAPEEPVRQVSIRKAPLALVVPAEKDVASPVAPAASVPVVVEAPRVEEPVTIPAPAPVVAEPVPAAVEAAAVPATGAPAEGGVQISDLVARIEAFRRDRRAQAAVAAEAAAEEHALQFAFETDVDGIIRWVDGAPRGALIGLSIAATALPGLAGVDGQVAGAFRQRAPFRAARLTVAGEGPAAGAWRLSAVPCFDPVSGRFEGYRGTSRRPRGDEEAAPQADHRLGAGLTPDSLRQLAHELKTPLNAIIGFGEMIHGQVLGPVSAGYRDRAGTIVSEAQRVLGAVEDLDIAARLESGALPIEPEALDGSATITRVARSLAALTESRQVRLAVSVPHRLPTLAVDRRAAERMLQRLLAAAVGLASREERIALTAAPVGDTIEVVVDRPRALEGLQEKDLLDPGYSLAGDWPDAPMLGLGFSLRLVRSLAEAARGRLEVEPDRFTLILPAAVGSAEGQEERG